MVELISGSQLDDWRRCPRRYYYAHDLHIMPAETDWPLAVGTAGHSVLATYFAGLQLGMSHQEAAQDARSTAAWRADVLEPASAKAILYALSLAERYWATYASDPSTFTVLAVEHPVRWPRGGWTFAGTIDLLVQREGGGGIPEVWDHRFLYDPYPAEQARLDPSLVRYALAYGAMMRRPIDVAARNMVSTAPEAALAKANRGRVKRVQTDITDARRQLVTREMDRTALEILAFRAQAPEYRPVAAVRTVIAGERYPACVTCPFVKLCTLEAWGEREKAAELKAEKFVPSDYGYQE